MAATEQGGLPGDFGAPRVLIQSTIPSRHVDHRRETCEAAGLNVGHVDRWGPGREGAPVHETKFLSNNRDHTRLCPQSAESARH